MPAGDSYPASVCASDSADNRRVIVDTRCVRASSVRYRTASRPTQAALACPVLRTSNEMAPVGPVSADGVGGLRLPRVLPGFSERRRQSGFTHVGKAYAIVLIQGAFAFDKGHYVGDPGRILRRCVVVQEPAAPQSRCFPGSERVTRFPSRWPRASLRSDRAHPRFNSFPLPRCRE